MKDNKSSLYYLWETSALGKGNDELIWSREGCYSGTQAYDRVNQYGQWYLSLGVKPGDLVAFYLQNSPDFMFAWIGLWSIGAAPAMINHNLAGKALIHCLKISDAKLLLVDSNEELQGRIDEVRPQIEEEVGMRCVTLGEESKRVISGSPPLRPGNEHRDNVTGGDPMCLYYTR